MVIEFGAQQAIRMAFSFCMIVDRSIPNFDQTLMTPSSPAVSRPVPSGLHRAAFTQPWCAFMMRSTRAFRFNIMNRPSLLPINRESLPLPLLFDGPDDFAVIRELHSHCRSVGRKSSGSFATWFGVRVFALHLYKNWSSLLNWKWIQLEAVGVSLEFCAYPTV